MQPKSLQSCSTLCDPMDCSPPGCSVHGISLARILEWVTTPSSGIFLTQGWTWVSYLLNWQTGSLPLALPGKPSVILKCWKNCIRFFPHGLLLHIWYKFIKKYWVFPSQNIGDSFTSLNIFRAASILISPFIHLRMLKIDETIFFWGRLPSLRVQ